jgi:cytochrome c biogenesis protein CcmG/thiol:disulfide interchange protein DsbE
MKRQIRILLVATMVLVGLAAKAAAELEVGTKAPEITATDWLNTPPLTLAKLRGRIVVVEFWATWCPPCRATIPHLIELHKQYGSKGVVICSLTNESKSKVEAFAQEMGMIYPVGCGSTSGGAYGVRGIPHAFIVDPTGVIAWHGHPAGGLDAAIEKQLKATPPTLMSPKEKAAAEALLEKVEALIKKEQYAPALAMLGKLKQADADPKIATRVAQMRAQFTAQAEEALKSAQEQIEAKQYYPASLALLRAMSLGAGTPQATEATKQYKELLEQDDARAAIEKGKREKEAADLLAELEKAVAKKTPAATLAAYDDLANRYPGTKAGATAAAKANAIRADKTLMAKMAGAAAEKDCKGWLSMARNFIKAGMNDKAKPYLEKVIAKYPGTDFAKEAAEMLARIEK